MPPAFIKTPAQEKKWKRAKQAVSRSRDKAESDFTDQDWGLVNKIYHSIKKAQGDNKKEKSEKYVVYSVSPKTNKKIVHQAYDDPSEAKDHAKNLRRLYGEFIQVGIDVRHGRLKSSVMKCLEVLKKRKK